MAALVAVRDAGFKPALGHIAARIAARIVDTALVAVLATVMMEIAPLEPLGDWGWVFGLGLAAVYDTLFHGSKLGATPGKLVLRLRVVDRFGARLQWRFAILRALPFAVPLTAKAIGETVAAQLPTAYTEAVLAGAIVFLLFGGIGSPIAAAASLQFRSYADRIGRSITLSQRQFKLLGLPRAGITLFELETYKNINIRRFIEWVLVHAVWLVPLAVFVIISSLATPIAGARGDLAMYLRAATVRHGLPVTGITVLSRRDWIAAEEFACDSAKLLIRARLRSIYRSRGKNDPASIVSVALWELALPALPPSLKPAEVAAAVRRGPDLGFVSAIEVNNWTIQSESTVLPEGSNSAGPASPKKIIPDSQ